MKRTGYVGAIILGVIFFVGLIVCLSCLTKINAGYVGVVYNMNGGVDGEKLSQGWHFVAPTKKVTEYSIGLEQSYLSSEKIGDSNSDESFSIPTSDGKTVRVNLEFSYRFDEECVTETFVMFKGKSGEQIKDTFIKPKIVAWTQEVSANYPVTDIFGDKRTQINAELDVYLRNKFNKYGIIIDTVNFTDISVDDETAAAIQKKVTAQQELELAEIEARTAMIQAEKEKEVALMKAEENRQAALIKAQSDKEIALIDAEQKKIAADAEAYQITARAEAEAEANKKIAESVTDALIQYAYAQGWDGKLPTIVGGGDYILPSDILGE